MDDQTKRRWKAKETVHADWAVLPGEWTATEIWNMRQHGRFAVVIPVEDEVPLDTPEQD